MLMQSSGSYQLSISINLDNTLQVIVPCALLLYTPFIYKHKTGVVRRNTVKC